MARIDRLPPGADLVIDAGIRRHRARRLMARLAPIASEPERAFLTSAFHDIRGAAEFADCLDPRSYLASQQLALVLLEAGSLGIVYPSVRRAEGTNLVCFRPALVGNVRRGAVWRLGWEGGPQPRVEEVQNGVQGG